LILFILGLIQKKTGQWVAGVIMFILSIIIAVIWFVGIIVKIPKNFESKVKYHSDEYEQYDNYNNDTESYNDEDNYIVDDKNNSDKISGFIQDVDKSLVYIKIVPEPALKDYGIKLNKIDTYSSKDGSSKMIPLNISFTDKFKGELQLILYSSGREELGKSLVHIGQEKNTTFTVRFIFEDEANFLKTDYALLKSSD
jgi:hypothetical protein